MKSVISVNYRFMEMPPSELLELVAKYADGVEVYADYHQQAEVDFLDEVAALAPDYAVFAGAERIFDARKSIFEF